MNGDMPMTQLKDGTLSGTDGEIMTWVAGQIGLTPNVVQMDWAALIEATKQGKLDVMHGAMGWIEPRTKIMILSEPIYYFGTLLAQKDENNFTTFADMKGRKVGTIGLATSTSFFPANRFTSGWPSPPPSSSIASADIPHSPSDGRVEPLGNRYMQLRCRCRGWSFPVLQLFQISEYWGAK